MSDRQLVACLLLCCLLQGKLEALPMPEAIELLQGAWSTAYKEVGKQGEEKVATIDMVTGMPTARTRLGSRALVAGAMQFSGCPICCLPCCSDPASTAGACLWVCQPLLLLPAHTYGDI